MKIWFQNKKWVAWIKWILWTIWITSMFSSKSMLINNFFTFRNRNNNNLDYEAVFEMQQKEMEDNFIDLNDGQLKLFIGGLNYLSLKSIKTLTSLTLGDIKAYFETFGRVSGCTLLVDKASGKSRGFAFVTIEDPGINSSRINKILS